MEALKVWILRCRMHSCRINSTAVCIVHLVTFFVTYFKYFKSAVFYIWMSARSLSNGLQEAGDQLAADERLAVIDVDTGLDDALAILMLLAADAQKTIKLKGITCVAGNSTLNNVCVNTLRLLRATNRLDIPVFAGATSPLITPPGPVCDPCDYHGQDGFGDLNLPDPPALLLLQKENAVSALHRLCTENKGKIDLIAIGPLTNIALAMRTYPDFNESVKSIHIMGGNSKGVGNTTSAAEFNFYADPEAAHIVLEDSRCPIQIVPWETCFKHYMQAEWRKEVLGNVGGEAMKLLNAAEHKYDERWVTCDPLTVACYLKPHLVTGSTVWHASVELAGVRTRGQMVLDHLRKNKKQNVTVIETFDVENFKRFTLWCADRWTKAET